MREFTNAINSLYPVWFVGYWRYGHEDLHVVTVNGNNEEEAIRAAKRRRRQRNWKRVKLVGCISHKVVQGMERVLKKDIMITDLQKIILAQAGHPNGLRG